MTRVEVLSGPERRRRWSEEEKLAIVAETQRPGATVSTVARRHGLHPNQLFKWRRDARQGELVGGALAAPSFVPVHMVADETMARDGPPRWTEPPAAAGRVEGLIEIDLGDGRQIRVDRHVNEAALRRVLRAMAGR